MTFDARKVAAEVQDDYPPFPFIGLDGETYELPNPLAMTERQVAAINGGDLDVLKAEAPDAVEALLDMPVYVSRQLGEQWMAEAEEAGKSPSPSRATRRAAERSKQT